MMRKILIAATMAAALIVPSSALAANPGGGSTSCTGDIGYWQNGQSVVTNNLVVPNGATCRLFGVEVQGNVTVNPGATLHTFGFTADQNVNVNQGFLLNNNWGFTIKGNLKIDGGQGDPYNVDNGFWSNYSRSTIGGNFTYTNNTGWFYAEGGSTPGNSSDSWAEGATVKGSFTYSGNGHPYTGGLIVSGSSNIS
jgi:hypothetical protein